MPLNVVTTSWWTNCCRLHELAATCTRENHREIIPAVFQRSNYVITITTPPSPQRPPWWMVVVVVVMIVVVMAVVVGFC